MQRNCLINITWKVFQLNIIDRYWISGLTDSIFFIVNHAGLYHRRRYESIALDARLQERPFGLIIGMGRYLATAHQARTIYSY